MKTKSRVKEIRFIFSVAVVAVINFALNSISHALGWNLPLDTIGTMLIAMECGYFPGILVAFFTNILECTRTSTMAYVMVINVSIAAMAGFFYKKNWFKKWYMIFLFILSTAAISCLFEITLVLDSFAGVRDVFFGGSGLVEDGVFLFDVIRSRFLYHLVDKLICLSLAALIMKVTPKNVKVMLHNFAWLQRPLSETQEKKISGYSAAKKSINKRIILVVVVVCASITFVFLFISQKLFFGVTKNECYENSVDYSRLVAEEVDGDKMDIFSSVGMNSVDYRKTLSSIQRIYNSSDKILNIYVCRISEKGVFYVFDAEENQAFANPVGAELDLTYLKESEWRTLLEGKALNGIEYRGQGQNFVTSFSPIFNNVGECVAFACVDINMEDLSIQNINFVFRTISLGVGFLIVVIAWTLWIAKYHVIYPIDSMVYRVGKFDFSNDAARKKNMEKFRALNICTGSEIENLYFAFLQVMEESMINFTYFQLKSDQMNRLQTGVIYVLADLVENRDSSTGDHIKKTAAYVDIILRKMKELGYYEDQMTQIFMENCIKSAPLHDVGKIRIPDRILNKPGKLTEEEFEVMKTHAQYGADIIQQIIDTIPDSQYLYEAKRIAGSHHEKWNGTGYPRGLREEEIPLSARVMAVADVFDALISVRCYKKAFSYEEAMEIIKKDSGSHFDPKVADAFLAAADEVKKVSDEFARGLRDVTP